MWVISKFLPLILYPVGLSLICLGWIFFLKKKPVLKKVLVLFVFALLFIGSNRLFADWLLWQFERQIPVLEADITADAILVLGGVTEPPNRYRSTPEINDGGDRLVYAAKLYKEERAPLIIVTGGKTDSLTVPESDVMADFLYMLDIPDTAILRERESFNTEQNAEYSKQILLDKGLDSIILVSSAAHLPRASLIFGHQNIQFYPAPTDYRTASLDFYWVTDILPEAKHLAKTTSALKELLGTLFLKIKGY